MGSACSTASTSKDAVVGADTVEKSKTTGRASSAQQPELWGNSFFSKGGGRDSRRGGGFNYRDGDDRRAFNGGGDFGGGDFGGGDDGGGDCD